MTVIDRPWLFKDDDGMPRFRGTAWYGDPQRVAEPTWPGPRRQKKAFEPHDGQTRALMRLYEDMYRFQESGVVVPLLEGWKWREKMESVADKQAYLEPIIDRARRAPEKVPGRVHLLAACLRGHQARCPAASICLTRRVAEFSWAISR